MNANRRFLLATVWILALAFPLRAQDDAEALKFAQRAQGLARDEKYDEATTAMKKAVRLAPRNDQYLALLGEIERRAGHPADATEHALQAFRLNDKVALYPALVAACAYANQDIDLAREYCQKALRRGEKELGAGPYQDIKTLDGMLSKRTFTIVWDLNPQKGAPVGGALTVVLPKGDLPYQNVTYTVAGARSHQLVRQEGNDLLRIVPDGVNPVRVTTKFTTQPYSYKKVLARRKRGFQPRDARTYLASVDDINASSAKLTRIVATARGKDDLETVQNIQMWMKKNVHYKEAKSIWGLDYKSADEVVERGYAECRGFSVTFVALCRAANIPARPVWGLAMLPPTKAAPKGDFGSHNWAEVYISGAGWVPVDPQKPDTLGLLPNNDLRIFMFTRRSLSMQENLPLLNLLSMNGDHIKVEETH